MDPHGSLAEAKWRGSAQEERIVEHTPLERQAQMEAGFYSPIPIGSACRMSASRPSASRVTRSRRWGSARTDIRRWS